MADPETGKLKGFGFCEYEHPEGASRAVRILSNLKLDESNLLVTTFFGSMCHFI